MKRLLPLLLAATLLSACGEDDAPTTTSVSAPAASSSAFPVSITDQFGTAKIDAEPKRVVTVGFNEQDSALALGVKPVGVRTFLGSFPFKTRPWAPGANDPAPAEVGGAEISYERVAAARPDVILGVYSFIDETAYGKLAKIAPTVANGKQYPDGSTPWDEQLRITGKALGREQKATEVIDGVNAKFAAATKAHPEFKGKSITVAFATGAATFVLSKGDLRSQFFGDLGFVTPEKYSKGGFEENISLEQLAAIDTDVIVLIQDEGTDLQDRAAFKNLRAAKEGRVIPVDGAGNFAGALGFNSPLSRPFLLDLAVPRLAAALDGDPATEVEGA